MTVITFKQYLLEAVGDPTDDELKAEADAENGDWFKSSKIRKTLMRDCAPFMKECKRGGFLYRGIKGIHDADPFLVDDSGLDEIPMFKKAVRTDRRPLNTSSETHAHYDKWFEKKFGYKVRSESIFCYPEDGVGAAKQYGPVCLVFPIGDFKYVWSPNVYDLQIHAETEITDDLNWDGDDEEPPEHAGEMDEATINKMLDKAGYRKTGLRAALGDSREIMVKCAAYYAIPYEYRHDIHELVM